MNQTAKQEEDIGYLYGVNGIPSEDKIKRMSYVEIASALLSAEKDSLSYKVYERELQRHLARDQASIHRNNIIIGGIIAAGFGLVAEVIRNWP